MKNQKKVASRSSKSLKGSKVSKTSAKTRSMKDKDMDVEDAEE